MLRSRTSTSGSGLSPKTARTIAHCHVSSYAILPSFEREPQLASPIFRLRGPMILYLAWSFYILYFLAKPLLAPWLPLKISLQGPLTPFILTSGRIFKGTGKLPTRFPTRRCPLLGSESQNQKDTVMCNCTIIQGTYANATKPNTTAPESTGASKSNKIKPEQRQNFQSGDGNNGALRHRMIHSGTIQMTQRNLPLNHYP